MDIFTIILKTIFIYILVAVIFRIMGKREVGQLGTFDLVVFILIAELVALSLENKNNFFFNLIPVLLLVLFQIVIAKISIKSVKFRRFIDGKPVVIIKKGIIDFKSMIEQRYTLDDLLLQLREKDIRCIDEVDYAILEINGKLSVFKYQPLKIKSSYPMPIILDGKIQYETLREMDKDDSFIYRVLDKKKMDVSDIFYAFYKDKSIFVIRYSDLD